MSGDVTGTIPVQQLELYTFLHSLVNYAFGRKSYIVGLADELVRKYWPHLTADMRRTVARNLEADVGSYVNNDKLIGMEMDHKVWLSLLDWMKANP